LTTSRLTNSEPPKSKVSKTSSRAKSVTQLEKKLSSALRHIKHDIVLIGRATKTSDPVIFELSDMTEDQVEKILQQAVRGLFA
jgi:hypothetical protein